MLEYSKPLGDVVRRARKEMDLTQNEVADLIDVNSLFADFKAVKDGLCVVNAAVYFRHLCPAMHVQRFKAVGCQPDCVAYHDYAPSVTK